MELMSNGALVLFVLSTVLSSAAHAATATNSACAPTFNFFPYSKNSSLPTAWTQAAQRQAGNTRNDMLYNVALTSADNLEAVDAPAAAPELTVVPVHDLLVVGSSPSSTCLGVGATVSATTAAGTSTKSSATVQTADTPAQRRLLQSVITVPAHFTVQYKLNSSSWVTVGEYNKTTTVPRIVLKELVNYTDGYYCMTIKLTILASTGLMGVTAVPLQDLWTTTDVCFAKLDNLPSGNVTYTSCGAPLSINISGMQPAPVPLYPGSSANLFSTVFRFQSSYNRSADGSWPAQEPGKLEKWIVLPTAADAKKTVVYAPEDQQEPGYWNVNLEGSLMTDYTSLISIGIAAIDQYNEETAPEEIQGKYKVASNKMWPTGRLAGIQNVYTSFISLDGPDTGVIPVNGDVSFNWDWDGFGKQYCWFDGKKYYNSDGFTCTQPLEFKLPDTKNHTLTVTLQDVCGKNYTFEASYGTWGYLVTKVPKPVTVTTTSNTDLESGTVYNTSTSTASGCQQTDRHNQRLCVNKCRSHVCLYALGPVRPACKQVHFVLRAVLARYGECSNHCGERKLLAASKVVNLPQSSAGKCADPRPADRASATSWMH